MATTASTSTPIGTPSNAIEAEPVEAGVAEVGAAAKVVVGQAVGHQQRDAARDVKGAEGRDEGRHSKEGDQDAIDGADEGAQRAGQNTDGPDRRIERDAERV